MTVIPRKMAVDEMMTDVELYRIGMRAEMRLDGQVIGRLTRWDMDAGEVERFVTDERSVIMLDEATGEIKREVLTGKVEVTLRDA